MKKTSGFTLLELLVVIIIVGVLAGVAMPSLFRNIKRADAAEATTTIGLIKRGLQACALNYGYPVPCAPNTAAGFDSIGMTDPSNTTNPASKFNYTILCGGVQGSYNCTITATDIDDIGNTISMSYTSAGFSKSATGDFQGVW